MKVAFEALIKQIKNKSLVCGDKSTEVVLQFNSNDKTEELNELNRLQRADKLIMAVIMDKGEACKEQE